MDAVDWVGLLITSIIIIIGWFIVNWLSARRDRINKSLDLKVKYLVETWYKLESLAATEHEDVSDDVSRIIANIQLFGSSRQIKLVNKMVTELSENKTTDLKELLIELRQDIRKELHMEFISKEVDFIKFSKK